MKILSLILIFLMIIGCSTTKITQPRIIDTKIFPSSYDEVWQSLVSSLALMSLPIASIEKDSGLITTNFVIFASGILADNEIKRISVRPSIMLGTWSQGRYILSVFVEKLDTNSTKVRITSHIEAYENNVSYSWYVCHSKGVIERQIFNSIESKLGTRGSTDQIKTPIKRAKRP